MSDYDDDDAPIGKTIRPRSRVHRIGDVDKELHELLPNRTIRNWDDLSRLVVFFSRYNGHDWLFRGVSDTEYPLIPRIGRSDRKKGMPYSLEDEKAIFHMFIDSSSAYLDIEPRTEIETLALAQHHGVPTRLLDWTEGLLVAAWFAAKSPKLVPSADPRIGVAMIRKSPAIWVVRNVPTLDRRKANSLSVFNLPPVSYRPRHLNPRIAAQRSVFTVHADPVQPFTFYSLVKFEIAPQSCFEIGKRLDACGINHKTMFPDLGGLGEYLAWRYTNNWLSGYRAKKIK